VANHQLLDRRKARVRADDLDVVAVADIRRHAAGARVRVAEEAGPLQVGHDVAHGRGRHAEATALHERVAADGLGRLDVLFDDRPQDLCGSRVQRSDRAVLAARHVCSSLCVRPGSAVGDGDPRVG
jgi:hypothetical protein